MWKSLEVGRDNHKNIDSRIGATYRWSNSTDDAVTLIGNIYSNSNTIFTGEHFGKTKPIPIISHKLPPLSVVVRVRAYN
jgi:hypothetical protein